MPFVHLDIKGAFAVAILYHFESHVKLQTIITNNHEFKFNGRQLIMIPITQMVHLANRSGYKMLPKNDFDSLQSWVDYQFKDEEIKLSLWRHLKENEQS